MISVGDHVLIISPNWRKVRCRAMVMGVEPGNRLLLDRKLPTVKPGDLVIVDAPCPLPYWQSSPNDVEYLGIDRASLTPPKGKK